MTERLKGTPDPKVEIPGQQQAQKLVESEPAQRGRTRMTRGRQRVLAVIILNVLFWSAYVGHLGVGIVLFAVFILWHWAVFGWQPAPEDAWQPHHDLLDSWAVGAATGVVSGPKSAAGRALYRSRELLDEQGRREQERRMR